MKRGAGSMRRSWDATAATKRIVKVTRRAKRCDSARRESWHMAEVRLAPSRWLHDDWTPWSRKRWVLENDECGLRIVELACTAGRQSMLTVASR